MLKKIKNLITSKIKDKRKFLRIGGHRLLRYKMVSEDKSVLSFARNISSGGILFHAKEEIPLSSVIEMEISFPSRPQPVKVVSKVIRVKRLKKVEGFEIAVHFLSVEDKDKDFMDKKF